MADVTTPSAATDAAEVALRIDDVSLRFGGIAALQSLSFEAKRGRITGVIGPNGAGKTSLINCATGLYRVSSGSIRIFGSEVSRLTPQSIRRLGVSRTFQGVEDLGELTSVENVCVGLGWQSGAMRSFYAFVAARKAEKQNLLKAERLLDFVGIGQNRHQRMSTMSHGHQKLVDIARALASEPKIIFYDEPTAGMSRQDKTMIAGVIRQIRDVVGVTQIVVEHDVPFMRQICDDMGAMQQGRCIATGRPDDVLANPEVIRSYLGDEYKAQA